MEYKDKRIKEIEYFLLTNAGAAGSEQEKALKEELVMWKDCSPIGVPKNG